jgi:hypothetical protein
MSSVVLLFCLCVLTFSGFTINAKPAIDKNGSTNQLDSRIKQNLNDTILETLLHCKCVPYYKCHQLDEALNKEILCSDADYVCCNQTSSTEESTTTVLTPTQKRVILHITVEVAYNDDQGTG